MNIVIIDDHKLFRIGLTEVLRRKRTLKVVAEYSNAEEFLSNYSGTEAELALIDISLGDTGGMNGIELAAEIRKRYKGMKTAMLTMAKDAPNIKRALAADVDGYFDKDIDSEELIFGMKKIMQGGKYFTSAATALLLSGARDSAISFPIPDLTERERQVLQFIVDGYSSEEIANALKIGKRTVDVYRSSILTKFKLKNSSQLIKFILENKILS